MSRCLDAFFNASSEILDEKTVQEIVSEFDSVPQPAAVDDTTYQIFYSGTNKNAICTMQGGLLNPVEAMAFHNGLVLATGSLEAVERAVPDLSLAVKRDIGDQCILPGFVEPHLHIFLSALLNGGYFVDCDPLRVPNSNFDGVVQVLNAAKQKLSDGQWLLGYGYDPSRMTLLPNGQFQDFTVDLFKKSNLDDIPIMIINASGHLGYANQTALTQAKITPDSTVEGGGFYVKDSNNQLTGVCVEPASYQPLLTIAVRKNIGRLKLISQGLTGIVQEWSSKGFTTIFDAGVGGSAKLLEAVMLGHLASKSSLNIAGAAANLDPGDAAWVVGVTDMPSGGRKFGGLTIKTIKLWMDGSTQGFTGALSTPYLPDHFPSYLPNKNGWARWHIPEPSPIQPNPPDDIYDEMEKWARRGYQLMVHVNGDLASTVVIDAYAKLFSNYPDTQKRLNRLEHFTVTNPDQVKTAASLNLGVSHTIGHVCYWGDTFEKNILGQDRAFYIDPVKDDAIADSQQPLCYSFNSDSPVTQADALQYIRTAVTRLTFPEQNTLGTQSVGLGAAIAGVTINPAKQILMDDTIGSLEQGKSADFVILDKDIQSIAAKDINTLNVVETWWKGNKAAST